MTNSKEISKEITKMSYENALKRLEEIVETLSSKKVNLDDMVKLYEEGKSLHIHCSKLLQSAKIKIEEVSQD
jgi:exodeoxyribonuclease VII small subunit